MVISVPVFQRMALGKIIKVNFYGLFQSLDLRGVRLFLSQAAGGRSDKTKAIYGLLTAWRDVRTARTRSRRARLSPPWACCISPTPPSRGLPPKTAHRPSLPPRPPAPASRGAPTGLLGGGPSVSYWGPGGRGVDVDEGVRGQRGHAGGDGRQQEDPGRLVGAGTSHLLVNSLSPPHFSYIICKFAGNSTLPLKS